MTQTPLRRGFFCSALLRYKQLFPYQIDKLRHPRVLGEVVSRIFFTRPQMLRGLLIGPVPPVLRAALAFFATAAFLISLSSSCCSWSDVLRHAQHRIMAHRLIKGCQLPDSRRAGLVPALLFWWCGWKWCYECLL
jgi:hypothetical protein